MTTSSTAASGDVGTAIADYYRLAGKVDPSPWYGELRDDVPLLKTSLGFHVVSRYDDVVEVYSGERTERTPPLASWHDSPLDVLMRKFLTRLDPAEHRQVRMAVQKHFTASEAGRMEPELRSLANQLALDARERGQIDAVEDLAIALPVEIIRRLLGVSPTERETLGPWAIAIQAGMLQGDDDDVRREADVAASNLNEFIADLIQERRKKPGDDIVSHLLSATGPRLLDDEQIRGVCGHILVAGTDTTVGMMANSVFALLSFPDQYRLLREQPELAASALEECLRLDPPVRSTPLRRAKEDIPLTAGVLRPGDLVTALLGAANTDPRRFEEPAVLDIRRQENDHLTFSTGANFCLGNGFARMEGRVFLGAFAELLPEMQLTDDLERFDTAIVHGFRRLVLTAA